MQPLKFPCYEVEEKTRDQARGLEYRQGQVFPSLEWIADKDRNVHKEFARLGKSDQVSLAEFASRRGLLLAGQDFDLAQWEPVDFWIWHIERVRFSLDLLKVKRALEFKMDSHEGQKRVDRVLRNYPLREISWDLTIPRFRPHSGPLARMTEDLGLPSESGVGYCAEHDLINREFLVTDGLADLMKRIDRVFDRILSDGLSRAVDVRVNSSTGSVAIQPTCLLGAVYLSLARNVVAIREDQLCKNCQRIFTPSRPNNLYCPKCTPQDHNNFKRSSSGAASTLGTD